jgi:hypothetical protein
VSAFIFWQIKGFNVHVVVVVVGGHWNVSGRVDSIVTNSRKSTLSIDEYHSQ